MEVIGKNDRTVRLQANAVEYIYLENLRIEYKMNDNTMTKCCRNNSEHGATVFVTIPPSRSTIICELNGWSEE